VAGAITYKPAKYKYACGKEYTSVTVVNFSGPDGSKLCAYSCNVNLDLDGEPQAYAPMSKPGLRPKDTLGNAGFRPDLDSKRKAASEAAKKLIKELEQKITDLNAKTKGVAPGPAKPAPGVAKPAPTAAKTTPDPAVTALREQIAKKKKEIEEFDFELKDPNDNPAKTNPKNYGKIFWKWYGVASLTPAQAKAAVYRERIMPGLWLDRHPVLDQTGVYEDVFGRFPVVQSLFEPGPQYFVSALPRRMNERFPEWDQRAFLPFQSFEPGPFGALSVPLAGETGLGRGDLVFAVRLDTGDFLSFPFRDMGKGLKVAECSFGVFMGLGGDYHPEMERAAKYPNNFLVLYLAFPGGKAPSATLAQFATASNASDFPVMLSFIAQMTMDAKAKGRSKDGNFDVTGDPLKAFEKWKKSASTDNPAPYDVVVKGLSNAGAAEFAQREIRKHGSSVFTTTLTPPTGP
jgi:hypothetical protein